MRLLKIMYAPANGQATGEVEIRETAQIIEALEREESAMEGFIELRDDDYEVLKERVKSAPFERNGWDIWRMIQAVLEAMPLSDLVENGGITKVDTRFDELLSDTGS